MFNKKTLSMLILSFFILGTVLVNSQMVLATSNLLSIGVSSPSVAEVQKTLNKNGYDSGTADGIFGSKTLFAVLNFQRDAGIKADGIVGPQTRQALEIKASAIETKPVKNDNTLRLGSRGDAVKELQNSLNNKGYWSGQADGIFGQLTHQAVVKFQKSSGLQADGIVGTQTKKALSSNNNNSSTTPSRAGSNTTKAISGKTVSMVATAYCPCDKCNYPWGGYPSYLGHPLKKGIIAVDPNVIPLGTKLYVEGYGHGLASDTGGAIKGNRLDLCFSNHDEALRWGIQTVKVTILD